MLLLAVVLSAAGLMASPTAHADPGDNLASFDPVEMTCPYGSSVAFDGTQLYSSCWGSNVLYRIDPLGGGQIGSGQTILGLGEIGAMSWDSRGKLWVCSNAKIYTINTTTFAATFRFNPIPPLTQEPCRDGLAFDRADNSLWLSGDGDDFIYHFKENGTLIQTYTPGSPVGGGSGLAVSGSTIYVANPNTGVIYACNKYPLNLTFTSCSVTVADARPSGHPTIEDLECDSQTFAPLHAIWNESQGDPYMTAWEVPAGSCVTGGGPVPVGGIALLTVSSSGSPFPSLTLAVVATGVMAVMGAGLWYGRRRWLR
jgi:hypothetical protein